MRFAVAARRDRRTATTSGVLPVFLFLAVAFMIGWLLVALKFIFLPMLLALFATFLFSPPVEWLHRRGLPRPLGIAITLGLTAAAIWLGGQ